MKRLLAVSLLLALLVGCAANSATISRNNDFSRRAKVAFAAIDEACLNYSDIGGRYESALLDAKHALREADASAETEGERNVARILDNYLSSIESAHSVWLRFPNDYRKGSPSASRWDKEQGVKRDAMLEVKEIAWKAVL